MRTYLPYCLAAAIGVSAASSTLAAEENQAPSPYAMPDNSYIAISGTVGSVMRDRFVLDYGQGQVTVEMDDGDRDADGYKLVQGDKVRVSGLVDDDLFEATSIEASTVFVEKLGTTFFASAVDEEDTALLVTTPVVVSEAVVRGLVSEVNDDGFIIDTGPNQISVDVGSMPYNPLDDEGYQQIEKGDFVSVTGDVETRFFGDRSLEAKSVVTLGEKKE